MELKHDQMGQRLFESLISDEGDHVGITFSDGHYALIPKLRLEYCFK